MSAVGYKTCVAIAAVRSLSRTFKHGLYRPPCLSVVFRHPLKDVNMPVTYVHTARTDVGEGYHVTVLGCRYSGNALGVTRLVACVKESGLSH